MVVPRHLVGVPVRVRRSHSISFLRWEIQNRETDPLGARSFGASYAVSSAAMSAMPLYGRSFHNGE